MDAQRLKRFRTKQVALQQEIAELNKTLYQLNREVEEKKIALNHIKAEIEDMTIRQPVVSEHALIRYVERILKIDLKVIENEILSEENKRIINQMSSCKIPFKEDTLLIVKNKNIVTIVDKRKNVDNA